MLWMGSELRSVGAIMLNMFDMWNTVTTKLEAQSNVQQSQQPHTSGGSIKGNFHLIELMLRWHHRKTPDEGLGQAQWHLMESHVYSSGLRDRSDRVENGIGSRKMSKLK